MAPSTILLPGSCTVLRTKIADRARNDSSDMQSIFRTPLRNADYSIDVLWTVGRLRLRLRSLFTRVVRRWKLDANLAVFREPDDSGWARPVEIRVGRWRGVRWHQQGGGGFQRTPATFTLSFVVVYGVRSTLGSSELTQAKVLE